MTEEKLIEQYNKMAQAKLVEERIKYLKEEMVKDQLFGIDLLKEEEESLLSGGGEVGDSNIGALKYSVPDKVKSILEEAINLYARVEVHYYEEKEDEDPHFDHMVGYSFISLKDGKEIKRIEF